MAKLPKGRYTREFKVHAGNMTKGFGVCGSITCSGLLAGCRVLMKYVNDCSDHFSDCQ